MSGYSKEELYNLIKSPQEFNGWKATQEKVDLSETDFSYLTLSGIDFFACRFEFLFICRFSFDGDKF